MLERIFVANCCDPTLELAPASRRAPASALGSLFSLDEHSAQPADQVGFRGSGGGRKWTLVGGRGMESIWKYGAPLPALRWRCASRGRDGKIYRQERREISKAQLVGRIRPTRGRDFSRTYEELVGVFIERRAKHLVKRRSGLVVEGRF